MRILVEKVHVSDEIIEFVASIIFALRNENSVSWGPSPRASISLINVAKTLALLEGRNYVKPADVEKYAEWVLGHRIGISPEYEIEGTRTHDIVRKVMENMDIT